MDQKSTLAKLRATAKTQRLLAHTIKAFDTGAHLSFFQFGEEFLAMMVRGHDAGDLSTALEVALNVDEAIPRLAAAQIALAAREYQSVQVSPRIGQAAERVIIAGLRDLETVIETCFGLATHAAASPAIIRELTALLGCGSRTLASCAAMALLSKDKTPSQALAVLRRDLINDSADGKLVTALSLLAVGLALPGTKVTLESSFPTLNARGKVTVLMALAASSSGVIGFHSLCCNTLLDRTESPIVRQWAARALGNTIAGNNIRRAMRERIIDHIITHLTDYSFPWEVLSGIANALSKLGSLDRLFSIAVTHLSHHEPNMRKLAAQVLGDLEAAGRPAAPQLISQLIVEDNWEVLDSLASSLRRLGHPSELMISQIMGQLDAMENPEHAMLAGIRLFHASKACVLPFAPLVRRIADFDHTKDPATNWCRMIISTKPREALQLLNEELINATSMRQARLEEMISSLSSDKPRPSAFEKCKLSTLTNFVSIAKLIQVEPAKSITELVTNLNGRKVVVASKTRRKRERWTRKAVERILTEMDCLRQGGQTIERGRGVTLRLSEFGSSVLDDALRYLGKA